MKRSRPSPRGIAGIIERCTIRSIVPVRDPLTQQDAYLDFGPRWQNTTEAYFGEGEAIARFDLPAQYASDCESYRLHPALIDRATSFALPLIEQYSSIHDLFVPLSYSRVSVFAPLPSTIYSYARYRANQTTGESVVFDVMILDDDGNVLAEIDRFVMKRTAPGALKAAPESPAAELATSAEQPPDLLQLATTEGIRPADGLDIFTRILSSRAEGPVLVSSLNLNLLIDRTTVRRDSRGEAGVKFARPEHLQSEYRAPEDELETTLVKMWQDLLGIDQVGVDDNFFELGGESLIGLRFFNLLRKEFGARLPLDTLFQAPTVAACAALVRAQAPGRDDPKVVSYRPPTPSRTPLIIGIQTKGTRPPLFCVHDQKGYVLLYRELAAKLGKNQPFYGIQANGLDGTYAIDRGIEDMAERYVQQLQTFLPQGPYFLAGSSLGGIVAYEMAQRLLKAGSDVALLTMFDSWTPQEFKRWQTPLPESLHARAMKHAREIAARGPVGYYRKRLENRRWWREYYRMLAKQDQMRQAIAEYLRVGEALSPDLLTFHLEDIYGEAYRKYVPQAYPRDVVLFRATERANPRDNDPYLGWGHVKLGGLEVIDSPGPHGYMVREPYVGQLAIHLRDCIDRAASSASTYQGAPVVASLAAR
jgi:thioesterase domain-containing protein/acyl carrier protein